MWIVVNFFQIWPVMKLISFEKNSQPQHPNIGLFNFLKLIETSFTKFYKRSDVFHLVLNDMSQYEFTFSCNKHVVDVLAHVVNFHLQCRMHKFVKQWWQILRKQIRRKRKWQIWSSYNVWNYIDMYFSLDAWIYYFFNIKIQFLRNIGKHLFNLIMYMWYSRYL